MVHALFSPCYRFVYVQHTHITGSIQQRCLRYSRRSHSSPAPGLITDRETGQMRGCGFVEMASGATEAIAALHEKNLGGRNLTVNPATPRKER